ncbi:MAG: helix-turn-helix domain-containing protein [Candidatus Hodarchaeales archaeon]|jgi:excisionase family DNA binding protein
MTRERQKGLEKHYRIGQAAKIIGLTPANFRAHIKAGKILATRTPGGHWRISESELFRLIGRPHVKNEVINTCVIYARVSSQKQKDAGNLERQIDRLSEFARDQQLTVLDTIADVGNGLNENRK